MTTDSKIKKATGRCMCGVVRFVATDVPRTISACHCVMCRRWTGSALIEISAPDAAVTWEGSEHIATCRSSSWAERAWCNKCGSGLWIKDTAESPWFGSIDLPLGLFDEPNGFEMSHEIYIDHKPDSFAYAGKRKTLTRAECVAKFSLLDSE